MIKLPERFIENMKALPGAEPDAYFRSLEGPVRRGIRFNPEKADEKDRAEVFGLLDIVSPRQVPWCNDGYYIPEDKRPALLWHYAAGLYYLQEPSAMAPASFLPVKEGDRVLDLCAAPGGKTTQLAMKASLLVSNDISASRARGIVKNAELFGLSNTYVTAESPEKLADHFVAYFDAILVDAPCSGEGMFKKDSALVSAWEKKGPEEYHSLQVPILNSAYEMLKEGGYIMYSTCTFSPVENEGTVEAFLSTHPDMELAQIPGRDELGFAKGLNGLDKACRLYPHFIEGEGHFMALMKKKGEKQPVGEIRTEFFFSGDRYYRIKTDDTVRRSSLRFLRTGLLIGERDAKKGFVPSQALALALKKSEASGSELTIDYTEKDSFSAPILHLDREDPRILRYLKGETIEIDAGLSGRTLLAVENHPIGWGRAAAGRLKNDYPKGYIWH